MHQIRLLLLPIILCIAGTTHAAVFNLDGSFQVGFTDGADLQGLVKAGDSVKVEAFYDTDKAIPGFSRPGRTDYFLPSDSIGVRFTVNGHVWETTGSMILSVQPVEVVLSHPDGSIAATFGGPVWLGYTDPRQDEFGAYTTIETPFGKESGIGIFLLYLPLFPTALIPEGELPTNLDTTQLAGPWYYHGAVAGTGPNGDYFFNITSPVPEAETYALLMTGLGLLSLYSRKRRILRSR
jgi:hypothetical protein